MKRNIFFLLLFLMVQGCNSQKNQNLESTQEIGPADRTNNAKVDIRVNNKYDTKGNVLEYESTYSYFYKSDNLGKEVTADSFSANLQSMFIAKYDKFLSHRFNSMFFNDSLYEYDCLNRA